MSIRSEINNFIEVGRNLSNDYELIEISGEIYKIPINDSVYIKKLLLDLYEEEKYKQDMEEDDFTYLTNTLPNNVTHELAKKSVLDELKSLKEALGDGLKLENDTLEVKNVISLKEEFLDLFMGNETRRNNLKQFLNESYKNRVPYSEELENSKDYSINFSNDDKEIDSLIGTKQYIAEGSPIYSNYTENGLIKILDKKEECTVVGIRYSYFPNDNHEYTFNTTIRYLNELEDLNLVRKKDESFRKKYNAVPIDIIIKYENQIARVSPDCIIITNTKVKGV